MNAKKFLCMLLSLVMVLGLLPVSAMAAVEGEENSYTVFVAVKDNAGTAAINDLTVKEDEVTEVIDGGTITTKVNYYLVPKTNDTIFMTLTPKSDYLAEEANVKVSYRTANTGDWTVPDNAVLTYDQLTSEGVPLTAYVLKNLIGLDDDHSAAVKELKLEVNFTKKTTLYDDGTFNAANYKLIPASSKDGDGYIYKGTKEWNPSFILTNASSGAVVVPEKATDPNGETYYQLPAGKYTVDLEDATHRKAAAKEPTVTITVLNFNAFEYLYDFTLTLNSDTMSLADSELPLFQRLGYTQGNTIATYTINAKENYHFAEKTVKERAAQIKDAYDLDLTWVNDGQITLSGSVYDGSINANDCTAVLPLDIDLSDLAVLITAAGAPVPTADTYYVTAQGATVAIDWLKTTMEYTKDVNAKVWTQVNVDSQALGQGVYYVRYKETPGALASDHVKLTVKYDPNAVLFKVVDAERKPIEGATVTLQQTFNTTGSAYTGGPTSQKTDVKGEAYFPLTNGATYQFDSITAEDQGDLSSLQPMQPTGAAQITSKFTDYKFKGGEVQEVEAQFKKHLTVQFEAEAGSGCKSTYTATVVAGDAVAVDPRTTNKFSTKGFDFDHWYVKGGAKSAAVTFPFTPEEDVTLVAVLTPQYSVTYDWGYKYNGTDTEQVIYEDGTQKNFLLADPTRPNYTSAGKWYASDGKTEAKEDLANHFKDGKLIENVTYTAAYTEETNITFSAAGISRTKTTTTGEVIDPDVLAAANVFAEENQDDKVFSCWTTDKDGNYPWDETAPVTTSLILYAKYELAWTITLRCDDGSVDQDDQQKVYRIVRGTTIDSSDKYFAYTTLLTDTYNLSVNGWKKDSANGTAWKMTDTPTKDIVLYADVAAGYSIKLVSTSSDGIDPLDGKYKEMNFTASGINATQFKALQEELKNITEAENSEHPSYSVSVNNVAQADLQTAINTAIANRKNTTYAGKEQYWTVTLTWKPVRYIKYWSLDLTEDGSMDTYKDANGNESVDGSGRKLIDVVTVEYGKTSSNKDYPTFNHYKPKLSNGTSGSFWKNSDGYFKYNTPITENYDLYGEYTGEDVTLTYNLPVLNDNEGKPLPVTFKVDGTEYVLEGTGKDVQLTEPNKDNKPEAVTFEYGTVITITRDKTVYYEKVNGELTQTQLGVYLNDSFAPDAIEVNGKPLTLQNGSVNYQIDGDLTITCTSKPAGIIVASYEVSFVPQEGYNITSLTVDGEEVDATTWSVTRVTGDYTYEAYLTDANGVKIDKPVTGEFSVTNANKTVAIAVSTQEQGESNTMTTEIEENGSVGYSLDISNTDNIEYTDSSAIVKGTFSGDAAETGVDTVSSAQINLKADVMQKLIDSGKEMTAIVTNASLTFSAETMSNLGGNDFSIKVVNQGDTVETDGKRIVSYKIDLMSGSQTVSAIDDAEVALYVGTNYAGKTVTIKVGEEVLTDGEGKALEITVDTDGRVKFTPPHFSTFKVVINVGEIDITGGDQGQFNADTYYREFTLKNLEANITGGDQGPYYNLVVKVECKDDHNLFYAFRLPTGTDEISLLVAYGVDSDACSYFITKTENKDDSPFIHDKKAVQIIQETTIA